MASWDLLLEIVVLLGAALVCGGLFARLGQSPLLGYLLAGVVIGAPAAGGLIRSREDIDAISELGVTLLLFGLGLEFSWKRVRALGTSALLAGALQVVGTGTVVAAAGLAFGMVLAHAVAIGAMIALSSTAGVLRVLMERAEVESPQGRNTVAILLVQDMAVVPLALLIGALGGGRTIGETALEVGRVLLLATCLISVIYLLVNKLAVGLLAALSLERTRELTTLISFVVGFGAAWGAHAAGSSPALGAFVAGMLLGASPFATQIRADVASLRILLLTLFFTSIGLAADPTWMLAHAGPVLGVSAAIVAGKAAVVWGVTRAFRVPSRVGLASGLALGQIGEFAFVLGSVGVASGVVSPDTRALVLSCAIVTLFATPYLVAHGPRIAGALLKGPAPESVAGDAAAEVVIIGFGPAGKSVARDLAGREESLLVIDLNPRTIAQARASGMHGEVGDATQVDVLEHARLREARLVVLTLPSPETSLIALRMIRGLAPHVPVIARSRYDRYAHEFAAGGATLVFGDETEVGAALGRSVRETLDSQP